MLYGRPTDHSLACFDIYPSLILFKSLLWLINWHCTCASEINYLCLCLCLRIWKLAKKKFSTLSRACGNFWQKPENAFFGLVSKFDFRSPVWQIFTIFSACFIYGIKFEVSRSKTVVTREWSRQGLKFICLQNLRSKFYFTKIFF